MPRLQEVENQCAATSTSTPPNAYLADENLRGYTVLLSTHFQGFCRDLYSETVAIIASKTRISPQFTVQTQFSANCNLDHGNPNLANLKKDFERFGFKLGLSAEPSNHLRLQHLSSLNDWRNIVAHYGEIPASGFPSFPTVQSWRSSCDGLATSLDSILYNRLKNLLKRQPWTP